MLSGNVNGLLKVTFTFLSDAFCFSGHLFLVSNLVEPAYMLNFALRSLPDLILLESPFFFLCKK
jgi:hypothetical protein